MRGGGDGEEEGAVGCVVEIEEEGVVGCVVEVEEEGGRDGAGRESVSGGDGWLEEKQEGEEVLVHCVWL